MPRELPSEREADGSLRDVAEIEKEEAAAKTVATTPRSVEGAAGTGPPRNPQVVSANKGKGAPPADYVCNICKAGGWCFLFVCVRMCACACVCVCFSLGLLRTT